MKTIILIFLADTVIASAVMEIFRQLFKEAKDWVKTIALTLIALVVSSIVAMVSYYGFVVLREGTTPISIVLFALLVFALQREIDLNVLKPMINKAVEKTLNGD